MKRVYSKLHESDFVFSPIYSGAMTVNVTISVSMVGSEESRATLFLAPDPSGSGAADPSKVITRVVPFTTSRIQPGISIAVS
jgi:hypothetical protein